MESKTYQMTLSGDQLDRMAKDHDFRYATLRTVCRMMHEKILFDVVKAEMNKWNETDELVPLGWARANCDIDGGECR